MSLKDLARDPEVIRAGRDCSEKIRNMATAMNKNKKNTCKRPDDDISSEIFKFIVPSPKDAINKKPNVWIREHVLKSSTKLKRNFKDLQSFNKKLSELGFERYHDIGRGWYVHAVYNDLNQLKLEISVAERDLEKVKELAKLDDNPEWMIKEYNSFIESVEKEIEVLKHVISFQ